MVTTSPNFSFLAAQDPALAALPIRAERYVFDDPNTCLLKVRQFGELVAKYAAAHAGLDPSGEDFDNVLKMLHRNELIGQQLRDIFDDIRFRGNLAAHDHWGERRDALAALMAAHKVASWYCQTFYKNGDYKPHPFRVPPDPHDAEVELRDQLNQTRNDAALKQQQLAQAAGNLEQLSIIRQRLEAENTELYSKLETAEDELTVTAETQEEELRHLENQIDTLRATNAHMGSKSVQTIAARSMASARLLGGYDKHVPLRQLRLLSGLRSRCCNKDEILVRSDNEDHVERFCVKCGGQRPLGQTQFYDLDVWVDCPKCQLRIEAARVRVDSGNTWRVKFGFRCDRCYWKCTLASLLPDYNDLKCHGEV